MAEQNDTIAPHLLAIPFPIPGHINPLLHLCVRLANLGFKITFINSEANHKSRFASGANIHPSIHFVGIGDGSSGKLLAGFEALVESIASSTRMKMYFESFYGSLLEQGIHVSGIISDVFLGWTQDLADQFGIPRIAFATTTAAHDLVSYFLPRLIEEGRVPVKDLHGRVVKDESINFIPGLPLQPTDLPISYFTDHPITPHINDGCQKLPRAKFVLQSTFEELEAPHIQTLREKIVQSPNVLPVGPLLPPSFLGLESSEDNLSFEDKKCLQWLDTQELHSVLYVSFGSIAWLSAKQFEDLAFALEESRQPFLWVVRAGLVQDMSEDFFKGILGRTQNQGLVVPWCPQMGVLLHKSVGGFLSHCGWNSTQESLCAGVPMIGWPCMAEQNFNIKFLAGDWGVAISLWKGDETIPITKDEIKGAIVKLMKGEEGKRLRERALQIKDAARKSVMEGGSSYENLRLFARAMGAKV